MSYFCELKNVSLCGLKEATFIPKLYLDCYGSFDNQRLFSVKIAVFPNFFDFAHIWGILESGPIPQIYEIYNTYVERCVLRRR